MNIYSYIHNSFFRFSGYIAIKQTDVESFGEGMRTSTPGASSLDQLAMATSELETCCSVSDLMEGLHCGLYGFRRAVVHPVHWALHRASVLLPASSTHAKSRL